MKILITGVAGFIGSKLAYELTQRGNEVVGIDNINDYYDTRLKEARLRHFGNGWRFIRMDIIVLLIPMPICRVTYSVFSIYWRVAVITV